MFTAATWATIAGIGSLAVGAVGAGVSYSAQKDAAKTQATFGLLNAQAGAQQARLQGRQQMLSAQVQAAGARAQAASAANNSVAMKDQVEAESRIATENIRRSREEFARTLGALRAQGSESGLLETTGSPLDFLTKAAEDEQLQESEMRWVDENARRSGFRGAAIEKARGSQLGLNAALYQLDGSASLAAGKLGATQARLNGYGAQASATGMRRDAAAGLISSGASIAGQGYQLYQNRTPRATTLRTAA